MKEFIETRMERSPICWGCGTNSDNQTDCCSKINGLKRNVELYSKELFRLNVEVNHLRAALVSISKNSHCGQCQEAKLVAEKALGA